MSIFEIDPLLVNYSQHWFDCEITYFWRYETKHKGHLTL